MVSKIRPNTRIMYSNGNDGRDGDYHIAYSCPKCGKKINFYKSETACDNCGTFYDWGNEEPKIVITRDIKWQ